LVAIPIIFVSLLAIIRCNNNYVPSSFYNAQIDNPALCHSIGTDYTFAFLCYTSINHGPLVKAMINTGIVAAIFEEGMANLESGIPTLYGTMRFTAGITAVFDDMENACYATKCC
jgi:hypothetical protein